MSLFSTLFCFLGKHKFGDWEEVKFVSADRHRRQRHCRNCSFSQEEIVPHEWEEIDGQMDVCLACQTVRIFEIAGPKTSGIRFIRMNACRNQKLRDLFDAKTEKAS